MVVKQKVKPEKAPLPDLFPLKWVEGHIGQQRHRDLSLLRESPTKGSCSVVDPRALGREREKS